MDILYKHGGIFLQGTVCIPIYAALFYHFLKYMNVAERLWRRAIILAIAAHIIVSVLGMVFGVFSYAWIGWFIGALVIAYILTKVLIVRYSNAVLAAILIVITGQDLSPVVINFISNNVVSIL